MKNYLNCTVALVVALALLRFGEHFYLRNNASEPAKAKARASRSISFTRISTATACAGM